ncbi:phosphoheptose isomerase 2 [Synergistales bacterium]|nr:phosphoheptose isomerase 2 [Synergistales bacterium]
MAITNSKVKRLISESINVKRQLLESDVSCLQIEAAADFIIESYKNGGKVILCGNGGSASDAQHIEGELLGRFRFDRPGLPAVAITSNSATVTAIANDYGFTEVFSRQVQAQAKKGDVLIAISTSGNSQDIIRALEHSADSGVRTIALLGKDGGLCKDLAEISIVIPSDVTARIQECHIMIGHIICEIVENTMFGNDDR